MEKERDGFDASRLVSAVLVGICLTGMACRRATPDDHTPADRYWQANPEAAFDQVATANKDVLLAFVGAGSEGVNGVFREQILETTNFCAAVTSRYVLVRVDVPTPTAEAPPLPEGILERYRVSVLPLVFLCHPGGTPYARIHFRREGLRRFLDRIREAGALGKQLTKLEQELDNPALSERQRAMVLHQFLSISQPAIARDFHTNRMSELIAMDPDNQLGINRLYTFRLRRLRAINAGKRGDFANAISRYESLLREMDLPAQNVQDLYLEKATMHQQLGDWTALRESLEASLAAAPNGYNAPLALKRLRNHFPQRESAPMGLPGVVTTTLGITSNHYPECAFDGDPSTYYRSRKPVEKGETVTLTLSLRGEVHRIKVLTGLPESEEGRLIQGMLEISRSAGAPFEQVAAFKQGTAEVNLGKRVIKSVRIRARMSQPTPLYVREIELQ